MRVLALLLFIVAGPANAHETSREILRTVVVTERDGETLLWVRLPAPLLFADVFQGAPPPATLAAAGSPGSYRLDHVAIAADEAAFAQRVHDALAVAVDGTPVTPTVDALALRHAARLPVITEAASAKAAQTQPTGTGSPHMADAYVDAALTIPATGDLRLTMPADPIVMTGYVHLFTTVIDARAEPPVVRELNGAIGMPIDLPRP